MAPPLIHASQCDATRVMTALLVGGASVNTTWDAHHKSDDALFVSALGGNAAATRLLLEHGANTCHDDQLMTRNAQRATHAAQARPHPRKHRPQEWPARRPGRAAAMPRAIMRLSDMD